MFSHHCSYLQFSLVVGVKLLIVAIPNFPRLFGQLFRANGTFIVIVVLHLMLVISILIAHDLAWVKYLITIPPYIDATSNQPIRGNLFLRRGINK